MKNRLSHPVGVLLMLSIGMAGLSGAASASGFALIEQSVSGLGNAFAGGAAATDNASVQYFNPAAMTELRGTQISVAVHLILPEAKLVNGRATETTSGNPVPGTLDDGGENGVVPNFYYTRDIDPQFTFGLGINAPFGLATEYDNTWIGRYHALRSEVRAININPALAYKSSDQLSLGMGLSAQYIKAELSSAIDSASICLNSAAAGLCPGFGLATTSDHSKDSYANIKGDDWGFGFNLGLLYKPIDGTRIGLAYRSKLKQSLKGDATFDNSPEFNAFLAIAAPTLFTNTTVSADIDLPASASLSMARELNNQFELLGDITWTQWSSFKELRIIYDTTGQPDSVTTEDWKDTLRYAVGLSYKLDDRIKLRTGLAYDEAPVPNVQHRTPRIPDNNRSWLALGMSYTSNDRISYDVGYAHLFVSDTSIDNTTEASTKHNIKGTYQSGVDILSAQMNYRF